MPKTFHARAKSVSKPAGTLKKAHLKRIPEQERELVHLWYEDYDVDDIGIVVSVTGTAGDMDIRITTANGNKMIGLVGGSPESVLENRKLLEEYTIPKYLRELGYDAKVVS